MANKDTPNGFKVVKSDECPVWREVLLSGASVKVGDPLVFGTDGYLNIAGAASTTIDGVALHELTGDGTKTLLYAPTLPGILFEAQCSGTGARTNLGQACDIEGSTGVFEINENSASTGVFIPVEKKGDSAYGANTRFYGTFVKSKWF